MTKCRCQRTRIVSDVVKNMNQSGTVCRDVCTSPICKDPCLLGMMTPLIYDEVGINLCATFAADIATAYPTATNASIQVIEATYTYGAGNVQLNVIPGRTNCYSITLANLTIQFAIDLFDATCRYLGTIYPTAVYLPPATGATYDEDTNPSSVELDLFAPYGVSYASETGGTFQPVINFIGRSTTNNFITQGINLFAMAKVLNLNTTGNEVTVGLTLVLQSLYFVGYKVKSAGKIDIPKGSIMGPEESDCMRFVAGDPLNLAIKPLDLGEPMYEERYKCDCNTSLKCNDPCDNDCQMKSLIPMETEAES